VDAEIGFRFAAVQLGYWLGWAAIVVVLTALALDVDVRHRSLLVGATMAAAAANTAAMLIPWRAWLADRRGRFVLDLWCGGLIAFVALLVMNGGSSFSLLLFLTAPFIAVVHAGRRRGFWLAVTAATCLVVAASIPLSPGATAMRLALVAVTVAVAIVLGRAMRLQAAAQRHAAAQAAVERTLAKEASHRIKNDLQLVSDLLLLGRPADESAATFDEAAARIRSIATVHQLLAGFDDKIDAAALLRAVAENAPVPVEVEADPVEVDAATAQKIGIVANELVTNALRHGTPPIVVRLSCGERNRLCVDDGGRVLLERRSGLGLELVRRLVEQGLGGRFDLGARNGGGTRAEISFPLGQT
jgi:two-component sensor histidine kinase